MDLDERENKTYFSISHHASLLLCKIDEAVVISSIRGNAKTFLSPRYTYVHVQSKIIYIMTRKIFTRTVWCKNSRKITTIDYLEYNPQCIWEKISDDCYV